MVQFFSVAAAPSNRLCPPFAQHPAAGGLWGTLMEYRLPGLEDWMRRRTMLASLAGMAALPARIMVPAAGNAPSQGRRPRLGIALGGGSVHGMAHIGVLKAFAEKGVAFDLIAGSSAGAVIGVLAAAHLPVDEIDRLVRGIEWPGLRSFAWSGKGLLTQGPLQALIDSSLGRRRLEQLPIPVGVVATDMASGQRIVLRTGPAGEAVAASCSIPVMFTPVKIGGRELIDGGLSEPVPVLAAREMGADRVIGVDVAFRPDEQKADGLFGVAMQAMQIMSNALINEQIRHADLAIRMNLHPLVGGDKSHQALVDAGYRATLEMWPKLVALLR
jgi:NTE family protein